jgi:hypothetical protein
VPEQRDDPFLADQPGVQRAAGAAGSQGVIAGIDVVRPYLVRTDLQATGCERAKQAGGDTGLAVPAGRGGDHDPSYHSIFHRPF